MSLLVEAMQKEKVSGKELSEMSGVSESTIVAIRRGQGKTETLIKLLGALGFELTIKKVK